MQVQSVFAGQRLHEARQRSFGVSACDQVEVVGHLAICESVDLSCIGVQGKQIETEDVVAVEGALAIITALGDTEVVHRGSEVFWD